MGVNYKRLAETRGKILNEYQEFIVPGYAKQVSDLEAEIKRLKDELLDEKYSHDRQCDFTVGQGKVMRELKEEIEHLKNLLELVRGERDAVTKRMIELETMNGNA